MRSFIICNVSMFTSGNMLSFLLTLICYSPFVCHDFQLLLNSVSFYYTTVPYCILFSGLIKYWFLVQVRSCRRALSARVASYVLSAALNQVCKLLLFILHSHHSNRSLNPASLEQGCQTLTISIRLPHKPGFSGNETASSLARAGPHCREAQHSELRID